MTPPANASAAGFRCCICEEASSRLCVWCTKDACDNHLCSHCHRCSDCCECEVRLDSAPQAAPESQPT